MEHLGPNLPRPASRRREGVRSRLSPGRLTSPWQIGASPYHVEVPMREKTVSYEVAKRHLLDALSGAPRKPAKRATRTSTGTAKPAAAAKSVVKRAATAPIRR